MDISPKGAFFASAGIFIAIVVAIGLLWALVGEGTALILSLIGFAVFFGTLIWLYRNTKHQ